MLTKAFQTFKKIDFVGPSVRPTFNFQSKIQSTLGATLSFIIGIAATAGFIFFGKEVVEKKNPRFTQSTLPIENAIVPIEELVISAYVRNQSSQFIHFDARFKRAVTMYGLYTTVKLLPSGAAQSLAYRVPMNPCKIEDLPLRYQKYVEINKINASLQACPDWKNSSIPKEVTKEIRNNFLTINSSTFFIYLEMCNEKADPGCSDYFTKELQYLQTAVILEDTLLDITSFSNPLTTESSSVTALVSPSFYIAQISSINVNELVSDSGWILPFESSLTYYNKGSLDYQINPYNSATRTIFRFALQVPKKTFRINRQYTKIQEVIANVGGLMKGLMMLAVFITDTFSYFILETRIKLVFGEWEEENQLGKKQIDNFIKVNGPANESSEEVKKNQFKTGASPTEMVRDDATLLEYFKYLFSNICRKKKGENLESYLKFIDFKFAFSEIIRLKEQVKELKESNQPI